MKRFILRAVAVVLFLFVAPSAIAQDYLSPELRTQVEKLKKDTAAVPLNNANARERTRVLWDWLNAYSMQGKHVPPNANAYANAIMNAPKETKLSKPRLRSIASLIRQFTVFDEQPGAMGTTKVLTPGPFPIESLRVLKVQYTIGEMPLEPGGIIVINRQFQSDAGQWQYDTPTAENYISIASSNPDTKFGKAKIPWRGMHGGFRGPSDQLGFEVKDSPLTKGDTFTVTYGENAGHRMQTYSNDAMQLPMNIMFSVGDAFFSQPLAIYSVVGGLVTAFNGFAPSIVATGEKFFLSVRAEDKYRNRAHGAIPKIIVALNGKPYDKLTGARNAIQTISNIKLDTPGTYRFTFQSEDGQFTGSTNPIRVVENPNHRIYWGETHGHCGFAEGQGSAESFFAFGRDDARLDFLTLSEHDIWMDDNEWSVINKLSEEFTEEGKFIAFPGYEWTSPRARGGHHNVFFNSYDFKRVGVQDAHYLSDLHFQLRSKYDPKDVLVIPHAHQAGDWRESDVHLERLVELMSMHGTFEWFGKKYLDHGSQVGFIAASDDHLSHPGYTSCNTVYKQHGGLAAVMADSLTGDVLFENLRNRSTYATSGDRIILEATINGYAMGTRQPATDKRTIKGNVSGTHPITSVDLIKNGEAIVTHEYFKTNVESHSFIQVGFESESEVFSGRDNPRGFRPWIGYIQVKNATIKNVTEPGFQNPRVEWAHIDQDDPARVNISTATRGRLNNLILELDGVSGETSIRIVLDEAKEVGTAPVRIRPFAKIPGADLTFILGDMKDNQAVHEFQVGRHTDLLSLTCIDPMAPMDQEFTFNDITPAEPGDYYYIRARQLNGGIAWSSPFWTGGEAPS